jgi:hypothetical protein
LSDQLGVYLEFEAMGGGQPSTGSVGRMLTIPLKSDDGSRTGTLAIQNERWMILLNTESDRGRMVDLLEVQSQGETVQFVDRTDLLPDESTLDHIGLPVAKASSSCAYVGRVSFYWACLSDGNPLGYQYDVYLRSGTYNPTSPNWWACWWGSIHVCPNPQTSFQKFPICGFPPRHPTG